MINFTFDYFDRMQTPDFILCNINKDRLGVLKVCEHNFTPKVNDIWELSFKIYRAYDGVVDPIYDRIGEMKLIYLPNIAYFKISECNIQSEGEETEYKEVTAKSLECTFGEKYLEAFVINMGTTESIDGVQLFNISDPSHSLMHLVLEKFPNWSIGLVDESLATLQRSFQVDKQDVYSYFMNDMANAFECEFDFDTLNNKVNVVPREETIADPKLLLSYKNLLQNATVSSDISSIKTCLSLVGENDLTVREVNMGSDKIYNFDYFHDLEWMSKNLYESLDVWTDKYNALLPQYTEISEQLMGLIDDKYYLTNEMMPEKADSEDYTEYCLNELETLKKSCENVEDTLRRNNNDQYDEDENSIYQKIYLPNHQKMLSIIAEIEVRNEQIEAIDEQINNLRLSLSSIASEASLENNLSEDEIKELSSFIMEDTLTDANFLTTDIMTDAEIIQVKREFLTHGQKELARVSQPQYQITANLANLFNIPVFKSHANNLQVGSFLHMKLRDDYILKLRVLSYTVDFETKELSVTFGNVNKKKEKNIFSDISTAISNASSAATSVSFNMANLKRGTATATEIDNAISAGLIAAGNEIKNTYSDAVWNERGLYLNATPDSAYPNDSVFLGAGQVKFSSDGWETCETALGRIEVNGASTFGLIAKMVVGGAIIGGTITGSVINNGNGTFSVDENGKMICSNAEISGTITANDGHIGGWAIDDYKIYGGDSSTGVAVMQIPTSHTTWVFAAGGTSHDDYGDCPFRVNKNGALYATGATIEGKVTADDGIIGGWTIGDTYIKSDLTLTTSSSIGPDGTITYDEESYRVYIQSYLQSYGADTWVYSIQKKNPETGNYIGLGYWRGDGKIKTTGIISGLDVEGKLTVGGHIFTAGTMQAEGNLQATGSVLTDRRVYASGSELNVFVGGATFGSSTYYSDYTISCMGNAIIETDLKVNGNFYNSHIVGKNSSSPVYLDTYYALYVRDYSGSYPQEIIASKFTVSSSERYKTNIVEVGDVRDVIENSTIFKYQRITDKDDPREEYGLVLERNCPELLMNDNQDGVDTYTMLSILWKDHQRLIQEYEELKRRVEILEETNEQKEIIENAETN